MGLEKPGSFNGADYEYWDPSKDPLIPARYGRDDMSGKAVCKRELQRRLMLQEAADIPLIGLSSVENQEN